MQNKKTFARRILKWFAKHGRHDLPWQKNPTPYRVWVSEIMLQQTQVNTVIPYYQRFMKQFPGLSTLANADQDTVLQYWAGLGYYARARNLHKTAQIIRDEYAGRFPKTHTEVMALPGIGRSTAGAILALSKDQRHAILDGNVKRVLARYFAVEGWPGQPAVMNTLWSYAEQLTPKNKVAEYTQAMMDLGATVCTRSQPTCMLCPVNADCLAYKQNRVTEIPSPKPKRQIPVRKTQMLILLNQQGDTLLEKRPPVGIWGGLLSLPELAIDENPVDWAQQTIGDIQIIEQWDWLRHTFSHFHLDIKPVIAHLKKGIDQSHESGQWVWYNSQQPKGGLAAPVKKLIDQLNQLEINI